MPMPRLARVEVIIGERLENITEAELQHLVDESISEAEDLEFKKGVYWQGAKKRELDVAALANHLGGLLIVGMDEDGNARASNLNAVPVDDATERSVQEIVANYVHPRPTVHTRQVEGTGGRFLLIAVPRSPLAPHAVQNPGAHELGYPVRTGTLTRWLSETEVADRYRNRFSEAAAAADRAGQRSSEVVERLDLSGPWLTLTVVPDIPGHVTIDSANGRRVHVWLGELPGTGIDGRSVVPGFPRLDFGPRRLIFSQLRDATSPSTGSHVEVFNDGAALVAVDISDTTDESGPYAISEEWLSHAMVAALGLVAQLCVDVAGATGTAMAVAEIVEPRRGVRCV